MDMFNVQVCTKEFPVVWEVKATQIFTCNWEKIKRNSKEEKAMKLQ
jgi:hypothetical protein